MTREVEREEEVPCSDVSLGFKKACIYADILVANADKCDAPERLENVSDGSSLGGDYETKIHTRLKSDDCDDDCIIRKRNNCHHNCDCQNDEIETKSYPNENIYTKYNHESNKTNMSVTNDKSKRDNRGLNYKCLSSSSESVSKNLDAFKLHGSNSVSDESSSSLSSNHSRSNSSFSISSHSLDMNGEQNDSIEELLPNMVYDQKISNDTDITNSSNAPAVDLDADTTQS